MGFLVFLAIEMIAPAPNMTRDQKQALWVGDSCRADRLRILGGGQSLTGDCPCKKRERL